MPASYGTPSEGANDPPRLTTDGTEASLPLGIDHAPPLGRLERVTGAE